MLEKLGENELTEDNFFRKCESNPNSIFYFDASKYIRDINDIISDIHEAGGLAFLAHAYEYSEDVEKDYVISTTPAAYEMAPKGSKVVITVSNGSEKKETSVPNIY